MLTLDRPILGENHPADAAIALTFGAAVSERRHHQPFDAILGGLVGRGLTATRTSFMLEDRLFLPAAKKETAPSLLGFAPVQRIEGK